MFFKFRNICFGCAVLWTAEAAAVNLAVMAPVRGDYAAAGNERIVFNQPAEKTGCGDKHDKPERRDPPGILPVGKKRQYDRCGVISGKAEAAYDAGTDEAYDHAFQSQKGSIEPLGPMFAEMSIHKKS